MKRLEERLSAVLNAYSCENESNTPDFILAKYVLGCLDAFNVAVTQRSNWYGRHDEPGRVGTGEPCSEPVCSERDEDG